MRARPLLFDTTALLAAIRDPARLPALRRAAQARRSYLTIAELHAGAANGPPPRPSPSRNCTPARAPPSRPR